MAKTVHFDLSEKGFEGQWVDLFDPRYMSQRRFEETAAAMQNGHTQDPKAAESFLRGRIAAWHVLDADSGEALADPVDADLGGLPLGILQVIGERVVELFSAVVPNLPKRE